MTHDSPAAPGDGAHWPWIARGPDLYLEALRALETEGIDFEDPECLDLLRSADALHYPHTPPLKLRQGVVRKVLRAIPRAIAGFDRTGRKLWTASGGPDLASPRPLAFLRSPATTISEGSCEPEPGSPPGLPHALAAVRRAAQDAACDGVEALTPDPRWPVAFGDLQSLHASLLLTTKPILIAPRAPEALDPLRNVLVILRGDTRHAERKPHQFWLARAAPPTVAATACRILIDGARHAIPVVVQPAPPAPDVEPGPWAVRGAAVALAMAVVHQLARRQAPLLWAAPLAPAVAREAAWCGPWAALLAAGSGLGLPTLVRCDPATESTLEAGGSVAGPPSLALLSLAVEARLAVWDVPAGLDAAHLGPALAPLTAWRRAYELGPSRRRDATPGATPGSGPLGPTAASAARGGASSWPSSSSSPSPPSPSSSPSSSAPPLPPLRRVTRDALAMVVMGEARRWGIEAPALFQEIPDA